MKNIAPGLSLKKYKGNKHEQGGIMVNALGNKTKDINKAVAEVEGGEYSYRSNPNNPKGPYIISAQLGTAKIVEQADRFKNNDRISYNTRTNLLNKSVKLNEVLKAQQEQSQMQQAALGGMLKKYILGGDPMDDISMQNSYRAVSTPGNELTNTPIQPTAPLVQPKLDVSKEMQQAQVAGDNPVKQKKNNLKGALSSVAGAVSALGPIGQGVGAAMQLAPYAIDLGKAMFDKTSVQDLQTQGSAMKLPNTTYAKHGGKLNVKPLPKYILGTNINEDKNPLDKIEKPTRKITSSLDLLNPESDFNRKQLSGTPFYEYPFNPSKTNAPLTTTGNNKENNKAGKSISSNNKGSQTPPAVNPSTPAAPTIPVVPQKTQWEIDFDARTNASKNPLQLDDDKKRMLEYDRTIGIPNALRSFYSNQGLTPNFGTNAQKSLDVVEQPKQKDKLSEMLKSGLMLKGSAMAGSLFSALQPAQKETLRLPDFGRADDAMSRATAFSMNPALNEVEQARGKSQEAIRNMATTAGQYTSNMQSVNQRAGQQAAGLRVQEQQIMNQLAGQKAGYETQKASAIQQELARFDENTMMNKAATQESRVAFVENINNLGTEIMKQGNEQDIASEQDKLAVQSAKLKIIQSAFENPDVISGSNLESILKMIEKGDYTNIPKLFGQTSDTRKTLKAEADRQAALQNNK